MQYIIQAPLNLYIDVREDIDDRGNTSVSSSVKVFGSDGTLLAAGDSPSSEEALSKAFSNLALKTAKLSIRNNFLGLQQQ